MAEKELIMLGKTIGEILVQRNVISERQLQEYLKESAQAHQDLDVYLAEHNLVKEEDLLAAYAQSMGVDFITSINEKMASPDLLAKIPIKFLRENFIIPLLIDDTITVVTARPRDFQPSDDLNLLLGGRTQRAIAPRMVVLDAINRYYPLEGTKQMIEELEEESALAEGMDFGAIEEEDILGAASEAPIIKLVNHMLYQAVKRGASDIHVEPFEKELRIRYRIDGVMYSIFNPPKRIQAALSSRIKIMANLNIAEKRMPQDGRIQIKIADKAIDIRVSVLPVAHGERIVMRLLDKTKTFGTLDSLGFSERDFKLVHNAIVQPNGIILLSGPTGSGKTSTLYSILSELNKPEVNIITVEDPVEYQMIGIGQVQVKEKIGLTFATALRSILRQDPDIIMIGETRDFETAQIAIQASLTGHLVLSTIHTNSAPATITRLIDMGIEPFLISSTIVAVIAQRLVRRLHDVCKQQYNPPVEMLERLGLTAKQAETIVFYKPGGCEDCLHTGYKGRLAIFEVMGMTNELAKLTIDRADTHELKRQAIKDGMHTLLEDGLSKIAAGLTSVDEVLAVTTTGEMIDL